VDKALRALSDGTRRRILALVWDKEHTAGEIASGFTISRPAVSQHLGVLRASKLVTLRRAGTRYLYCANQSAIARLRADLAAFWDSRLDRLRVAAESAEQRKQRP
jgi:DNA-binding transcriptional ArsR family regulator